MRTAAEPIFNMLVADRRFEAFSVKDLRAIAEQATSALVTNAILKKFEKASEATLDSQDWETKFFARLKAASEAVNDPYLIQDLYMMLHLRD